MDLFELIKNVESAEITPMNLQEFIEDASKLGIYFDSSCTIADGMDEDDLTDAYVEFECTLKEVGGL